MKRYQTLIAITAVAGGLLAFSPQTAAQEGQRGQGQRGQGQGRGSQNIEQRLERMATALELTEAQKKQLKPILEKQGEKMQAIFQNQDMSQEQRREAMTKLRAENEAQYKKILTAEQYKKWQEMAQQRRGQRGQRGQGQGGGQGQRQQQ